jgi:Ni/Fe-hydrogenase subunit HybB-like protein
MGNKKIYRSASQTQALPAQPEGVFVPGSITDKVSGAVFRNTPWWWWVGFLLSSALLLVFIITIFQVLAVGVGVWGVNNPAVWGVGIVNLVFWIGIGHAGTFISAFLLLMRQHWRSAFSRFAEAMTLFALACAGLFPILHVGRPQFVYWLFPYPNTLLLNPNWKGALAWDAVAIGTYGLVSLIFWYVDLLPDLAAMRDKTQNTPLKVFYSFLSLGWRGEAMQWEALHKAAYLFAAIATPLVISVHSVVSFDFAIAITPGWHHTIFPPYFVAGAVFSGLAMVLVVGIGLRRGFGMQDIITEDHIDKAARLMLVTGLMVGYGYLTEFFGAWYTDKSYEVLVILRRSFGPYAIGFLLMMFFNTIFIQLLWIKRLRRNLNFLVIVCLGVLVGMWFERFIIITASLSFGYLPSMWRVWIPTGWDWLTIFGPFGLFLTLLFIFIRLLPIIPIYEAQQIASEEHH